MTVSPYGLKPEEAIEWFRRKGYEISFDWRDVYGEEHARAFTVAKATQLTILGQIRKEIDKAIANGSSLATFQKNLEPFLRQNHWWGKETIPVVDKSGNPVTDKVTGEPLTREVQLGSPRRLRIIYETNLRQAMAAGRWDRIERTAKARPYLRYVAIDDGRARAEHLAWNNTILRWDDPWWNKHYPPNGWGCRCSVMQLSEQDLARFGLSVSEVPPTSAESVAGIDESFAYNAGTARKGPLPRPPEPPWQTPAAKPGERGILNQSHKALFKNELPLAKLLIDEGHNVSSKSSKPKVTGTGRQYDALVNGYPTEFKKAEGRDNITDLLEASARNGGQAPSIIIDVREQEATEAQARAQIAAAAPKLRGRIYYVRIIGNGFDFTTQLP